MHSISPYLLRCFNNNLEGRREQRYSSLDNLGQNDLFELLRVYITQHMAAYTIVEATQQVYRFESMTFDDNRREISGWFNVGQYGMKTDIINVETGEVDFEKAENNAEIIKHYIHFFIPRGFKEALLFMHSYRGVGVKTLFQALFCPYFKQRTNLVIQMNPQLYDKAMNAWLDADAKEIKLVKFVGLDDIADQIRLLGHAEQELVIRPPRRGNLGKLRDYFNPESDQLQAVEVISGFGTQVKTVVELGGKKRTFKVGPDQSSSLCEIELDDNVELIDGVPRIDSINEWVNEIVAEYARTMYPGLDIGELE